MVDISDRDTTSDTGSVTSLMSSTTVRSTPLLPVQNKKSFHGRKKQKSPAKSLVEKSNIQDLSIVESSLKGVLNICKQKERLQDEYA
jgi:hypothetical protein